jgi:hypothetical protein
MIKRCCICEKPMVNFFKNDWYCMDCYKLWEQDILSKKSWVIFLRNEEQTRRRHKSINSVYLGNKYDIDEDGNLCNKGDSNDR